MIIASPAALYVIVVCVVLLAALQILHLTYAVDSAKSVRRLVELEEMRAQPTPILLPPRLTPEQEEKFREALAKYENPCSENVPGCEVRRSHRHTPIEVRGADRY